MFYLCIWYSFSYWNWFQILIQLHHIKKIPGFCIQMPISRKVRPPIITICDMYWKVKWFANSLNIIAHVFGLWIPLCHKKNWHARFLVKHCIAKHLLRNSSRQNICNIWKILKYMPIMIFSQNIPIYEIYQACNNRL